MSTKTDFGSGERIERAMVLAVQALEIYTRKYFSKHCPPRWQIWKKPKVRWMERDVRTYTGDRLACDHEPGDEIEIKGWVKLGDRAVENVRVIVHFSTYDREGVFRGYFHRTTKVSVAHRARDEWKTLRFDNFTCGEGEELPSLVKVGWSREKEFAI